MILLGLTGSIGMGKTTIAQMLRRLNIPVNDADHAVHDLIKPGGKAYRSVCTQFPYYEFPDIYGRKTRDGRLFNRKNFGAIIFKNDELRIKLENILHPFVRDIQRRFVLSQKRLGADLAVLDIPLLFETGAEHRVDYTVVASAPFHIQQSRVLSRNGMNPEKFEMILKRQISDGEKRARADYILETGLGRAYTFRVLKSIIYDVRKRI